MDPWGEFDEKTDPFSENTNFCFTPSACLGELKMHLNGCVVKNLPNGKFSF
jgi:hypothetical protein